MGDFKIRDRRRTSRPPPDADEPRVAPGKTGLSTGLPTFDGQRCEVDPDADGCRPDWTSGDRTRVLGIAGFAATNAFGTWGTAIQNRAVRIRTLPKGPGFFNGVFEMLFLYGTGGAIGLLARSLGRRQGEWIEALNDGGPIKVAGFTVPDGVARGLVRVSPEAVKGTMVTASKGVRTEVKNASIHGAVDQDADADLDLLHSLQAAIPPMVQAYTTGEAIAALTDDELVATAHAFLDLSTWSLAACEAEVDRILDLFDDSKVRDLGVSRSMYGRAEKHLTLVTRADGNARMAVIEFYDDNPSNPRKMYDGKLVPTEQPQWVSWPDNQIVPYAQQLQAARNGATRELDATKPTGMKEVDQWAAS